MVCMFLLRDGVLRCGGRFDAPSRPYGLQSAVEGVLLQGVEEVVYLLQMFLVIFSYHMN